MGGRRGRCTPRRARQRPRGAACRYGEVRLSHRSALEELEIDPKTPLRIAFYGDDFTGSTDAMESLARAGVRTVLFLEPPSPEQLRRFEGVQAIGVAGISRSLPTAEMEAELLPVFRALRGLGAPLVHYKVCSTFDSSPEVGSIGRAIDLGQEVFRSPHVPVVVGAPRLGRYTAFGNLFARSGPGSEVFRLDRHPTMSQHPTTPMHEGDLRIHLAQQTDKEIGLLDLVQISAPDDLPEKHRAAVLDSGAEVVLFDVLYEEQLSTVGGLIWNRTKDAPLFAVGSSGLGDALVAHWQKTDLLTEPQSFEASGAVDRLIVVSGSCSPVTGRQISEAIENGFVGVPLNPARLVDPEEIQGERERAVREALGALEGGRSVVLHTCDGPGDLRIADTRRRLQTLGHDARGAEGGRVIGEALGHTLGTILEHEDLGRVVVAGGDTSGHVARGLGIEALEMVAPTDPGSPLCRIHAPGSVRDGTEIAFKGGQVGGLGYFVSLLRGEYTDDPASSPRA